MERSEPRIKTYDRFKMFESVIDIIQEIKELSYILEDESYGVEIYQFDKKIEIVIDPDRIERKNSSFQMWLYKFTENDLYKEYIDRIEEILVRNNYFTYKKVKRQGKLVIIFEKMTPRQIRRKPLQNKFNKHYEGFIDRFRGEYGFRVGEKPKKEYGKKFLELLEIPVSDIQSVLLEITDEIKVSRKQQNMNDMNDPERDFQFEYDITFPGMVDNSVVYFSIKNDRFLPISIMSTDPKKLSELVDLAQDIFVGDDFSFNISFKTKDIYNEEFNRQTFFQKIKSVNFNLSPTNFLSNHLDKEKTNIIKECGERICDMINFEKFELDIEKPNNNDGYSLVKLIFKI